MAEVVRAQMGETSPAELAALELLALSGSLGLCDLVALTSSEVVATLERRGLVAVEQSARHQVATLARPLDAQVLCSLMPQSVAGEARARLARTDSVRRWSDEDPLRIGALLLQLDGPPRDAAVLTCAAFRGNAASDHEMAERLARAAPAEGGGPAAAVALAESLRWLGRHEAAREVAEWAAGAAVPGTLGEELTVTRMLNLFLGLGSADEALALAGPADESDDHPGSASGQVGKLLRLAAGEPLEAADLTATSPVHRPDPLAALWGDVLRMAGLALLGDTTRALAAAARIRTTLDGDWYRTEAGTVRAAVMQGEWLVLELSGRIREAEDRAAELHEATLARPASAADAVAALGRGSTALAAGRAAASVRWLAEAASRLTECDPIGSLPLCRARHAQALALLGDPVGASTAMAEATAHPTVRVFVPEVLLAEAWVAAAACRVRDAGEAALRAAAAADRMGQWTVEARALHTAARFGRARDVVDRLRVLAAGRDGQMVAAFAAHAEAAARGLGNGLDEAATEFQELGALALAADAFAQAAEAHRSAGHRRQASASGARARALARTLGGLATPALRLLEPYALTEREHEIAVLAARGVPNQAIAKQLVLSVRTVETHLTHVYDKLGIHNRAALKDALANPDPHG